MALPLRPQFDINGHVHLKCTKCCEVFPIEGFPSAKGVPHSWCRNCNKVAKRASRVEYRKTHPRKKRLPAEKFNPDGLFVCSKCKSAVPPECANGSWCNKCRSSHEAARRRQQGIKPKNCTEITGDLKKCADCNQFKPFNEFTPARRGRGGLIAYCKKCISFHERCPAKTREYRLRLENKDREAYLKKHRVRQEKRRKMMSDRSDGTVTPIFLESVYERETCAYCNEFVSRELRTVDHVIPLVAGGSHSSSNIVMACRDCNSSKSKRTAEQFTLFLSEKAMRIGIDRKLS